MLKLYFWQLLEGSTAAVTAKLAVATWFIGESFDLGLTYLAQVADLPPALKEVVAMDSASTWKLFTLLAVAALVYQSRENKKERDKHFETMKSQNEAVVAALSSVNRVVDDFSDRVETLIIPALSQFFNPQELPTTTKTQTAKGHRPK